MAADMTRAGESGFTLVELLVVIAIIALLVSILMPSLQEAHFLALQAKCMSGQKNVWSAMAVYQSEYATMPSASREMSTSAFGENYETVGFGLLSMHGYVEAQGLLACPHTNYLPGSDQQNPQPSPFPNTGGHWAYFRQPNTFPMRGVQKWLYEQPDGSSGYKGYGYVSSYAYRRGSTQQSEGVDGGYCGYAYFLPNGQRGGLIVSRKKRNLEDDDFPSAFLACAQQWTGQGHWRLTENFTHERRGSNVTYKDGHVKWFQMIARRDDVDFMFEPEAAGCPSGYMPFCYPFDYMWLSPSSVFWGAADAEP